MPTPADPNSLGLNSLGIDPGLRDRQQANFAATHLATDLDIPLNHSPSPSSNAPAPPPPNQQPMWGFNPLQEPRYSAGDTLTLEGWIEDPDGFADLDRIDLTLDVSGRTLDLGQITQFVGDLHNPSAATFSYDIALKDLAIAEGYHYIGIEGIAYDRVGNGTRNEIDFQFSNYRPNFYFDFRNRYYAAGETIVFSDSHSWVEDSDGLSDLSHIDLRLNRWSGGYVSIDLDDITEFVDDGHSNRAQLNYSLDLSTLDLPWGNGEEWRLGGRIFDKAGNHSEWIEQTLYIYNSPPSLQFDVYRREYSASETISLVNARVEGFDVDRIDFKLIVNNAQEIDLPDVTEFISNSYFDYTIDLSTLSLPWGHSNVDLIGVVYDKAGNHAAGPYESFEIYNHVPFPRFNLDRDRYSTNEILTLRDTDIIGDIEELERIDFRAIVLNENNRVIDVTDAVNFIPTRDGASHGTFDYSLDLTELNLAPDRVYDIRLEATSYTKAGMAFLDPGITFRVENTLSQSLQFDLDRRDYTSRDTLTISQGSVFDDDGSADVDRIDFRLRTDDGTFIDLPDVTAITGDPNAPDWAIFNYSFDLGSLPLDAGTYNLTLEAIAFDRSGNGSSLFGQAFQFSQENAATTPGNRTNLNLSLDRQNYRAGDILTLENVLVEDLDGIVDIERIDFIVQTDRNTFIDIADVTQLSRNPDNPNLATFNYELDLQELTLELDGDRNYTLIATAYDRFGRGGWQQFANFSVRSYTPTFDFDFDSRPYSIGETLTFDRMAWVEDPEGLANLDRIDFKAIVNYGEVLDLPDVTEFISDSGSQTRGRFEYDLDLWRLSLHPYYETSQDIRLVGTLYDRFGNSTQTIERTFSINRGYPEFEYRIEERSQPYSVEEPVVLQDTRVRDFANIADLDRIDFFAWSYSGLVNVDLPDVTEFIALPGTNEAFFNYSIDLRDLGLDSSWPDHSVIVQGILYDKAGYRYNYYDQYFQVTNHQPDLNFQIEGGNMFAAGDTLILKDTWVEDPDGIANIDRIDFVAMINRNQIVDLPDATQFFSLDLNATQGTFQYELDLKTLDLDINGIHDVYLEGMLIDKAGNTAFHWQNFQVSNHLPFVDVSLDRTQYGFSDTLVLDGWFEDSEGIAEFDRIDLRLRMGNNWYNYIDIADITSITPDPNQFNRGMFSQEISLASLGLPLGNHDLYLEAIAYDKAGNGVRGMEKSFRVTNNVPYFDFTLPQGEYRPDDTISITQGWVEDIDGFNDIDRVDFSLRNLSNGELIDVADVVDFTADPGNTSRGSYAYSLYLGAFNLQAGNYDLQGMVFDKQGNSSFLVKKGFAIAQPDHAPQDLRFGLDKSEYTPNATILLNNGWILDEDGAADLTRVDLRLLDANDHLIANLNPVTNLEPVAWNPLWASFNTQINLNGLNLSDGTYTISAIAYDLTNQTSNIFERSFGVKSPPPNFAPSNLTFSLDRTTYQPTDTINLSNGWVRDENGADTLDRIDLHIMTEQGNAIDIDDITM